MITQNIANFTVCFGNKDIYREYREYLTLSLTSSISETEIRH